MKNFFNPKWSRSSLVITKLGLIILLLPIIHLEINVQNCPLSNFTCEFINPDAPNGVIKCGTLVKAQISFPATVQNLTLTIPSSFECDVSSAPSCVKAGTPLPQGPINTGIVVAAGQLMTQTFTFVPGPCTSPIELSYIYRGCNIYAATPQINTSHLYFDCEGGNTSNPLAYCASLLVTGMATTASGGIAVASSSPLAPIAVSALNNATYNNIVGTTYDREFKSNRDSLYL